MLPLYYPEHFQVDRVNKIYNNQPVVNKICIIAIVLKKDDGYGILYLKHLYVFD